MIEVRYIYDIDDKPINEYTIKNGKYQLSVINLGAAITKIIIPNHHNKLENITLRYHNYKEYKKNPLLLGALININKFFLQEDFLVNNYFNCEIENNQLIFSYINQLDYIIIKYTLLENSITIEYDNNLDIYLSQFIFFNLTGNLKGDILNHKLLANSSIIDLKENSFNFRKFCFNENEQLTMRNEENGIEMCIKVNNQDVYISKGEHFLPEFLINKNKKAEINSGVGILVVGEINRQFVEYEFGMF